MQLGSSGECEACPRGTLRSAGARALCTPCPSGTTTAARGASSPDQCTLPICKPGMTILFK